MAAARPGGINTSVEIRGLAGLQKAMRELEQGAPRELRQANLRVAEMVADRAHSKARSQGGVAAKAAPAVTAKAEQRRAKLALDGKKYPFAFGAEFGAIQYKQFDPWRGNQWTFRDIDFLDHTSGYFMYPALRESRDDIVDKYDDELGKLIDRHFARGGI